MMLQTEGGLPRSHRERKPRSQFFACRGCSLMSRGKEFRPFGPVRLGFVLRIPKVQRNSQWISNVAQCRTVAWVLLWWHHPRSWSVIFLNLQINNSRKFSDKKLPRLCLGHCCIQKCYEKDHQTHVKKLQQKESYFFVCKGCNTWVPLRHSSHFLMSSLGLAQNQGIATQTISVSELVQGSASNINTEQVWATTILKNC